MRNLIAFAALILVVCPSTAEEPKSPLSLEATVFQGQGGFGPGLSVRLVGTAKDVTVATEGLSAKVMREDKKITVTVTLPERKDAKGRLVIPSVSKLALVRL